MATLQVGDHVKHISNANWGTGKVLAVKGEGKYDIFFEAAGNKLMTASFITPAKTSSSTILQLIDDKTDFTNSRSMNSVVNDFLQLYPEGFQSSKYLLDERNYKMEASEFLHEMLGEHVFMGLLENDQSDEIWHRAKRLIQKTNLIFRQEKIALIDAINIDPQARSLDFSQSLFELLYGQNKLHTRFTQFTNLLDRFGALKWTTATYFLFLAFPTEQAFMKPLIMDRAAEVFSYPINRSKHVTWETYSRLIGLYNHIHQYLTDHTQLTPVDMIDIQSFIWCADPESNAQKRLKETQKQIV